MALTGPALIADIGGTNARFALAFPGEREARDALVLRCADYAGPEQAARAYLERTAPARRPMRGAFAFAGPITGDRVAMTNHAWSFSIAEVERSLGFEHLAVVNDFIAVAMAVPRLAPEDVTVIGPALAGQHGMPIGVLGPGTGLGVSVLVPAGQRYLALATEGGHATLPAVTEREWAVIRKLQGLFGHVSVERCLSGPGLVNLYNALAALDGREPDNLTPGDVSERGLDGSDPHCAEALRMFFALMGSAAGNLALSVGARGGIVLAGGILPRMTEAFAASDFRERFEAKGRFRAYLKDIPTTVMMHPYPAFLGLTELVSRATVA